MTTREAAEKLAAINDPNEALRTLLLFLRDHMNGYGTDLGTARREAKLEAERTGRWWLPCPLCGHWQSSLEVKGSYYIRLASGTGWCVCDSPTCQEEAARLNKLFPNGV